MTDLPATRGERQGRFLGSFDDAAAQLTLMALVTDGSQLDSPVVFCSATLIAALGTDPAVQGSTLRDVVGAGSVSASGVITTDFGHSTDAAPVTFVRQRLRQPGLFAWVVCEAQAPNAKTETLVRQLAHELNNPLTSVLWKLDLLARQLPRAQHDAGRVAELCRHVDEAHQGTKRVVELVKEFTDSLQSFRVQTEEVDVSEVLQDALRLLASEIELSATLVCDCELVPMVSGHRSRLARVFSNLLMNALQAVRESPEPQDHRIRVSVRARGCWVVASVDDTGIGMPEPLMRRVFEPFVTTRAASGGSGLGLFISREIVESVGGHLEVESSELTGTSFRVWLKSVDSDKSCGSAPPVSQRRALRR